MGRKSSIDVKGLAERILKMANEEKLTIKQITEILNDEGVSVSTSAVQRKLKTSRESAQKFMLAIEESKALIDVVRSNPNTDVMEVTTTLLARLFFEHVRDLDDLDFTDSASMTAAFSKLTSAQVQLGKFRMTYEKGFEAAKKAVLDTLKEELNNHPDLMVRLTMLIGSMEIIQP